MRRLRILGLNTKYQSSLSGGNKMTWKTPTIVEIALGAEINCYACAEL
jgi:coenzyme PQQ precursor peptide PqqA